MDRFHHILKLITIALTILALIPKSESQIRPPQRPLCPQQFALANYACSRLPFTPLPPPDPIPPPEPTPTPPSPDGPIDRHRGGGGHGHGGHRHGHGHGHRHRRRQTPEEDNCCRWAREVDSQCVCELLVRLPPFLMRPLHQYTLLLGEACEITYPCGGPI